MPHLPLAVCRNRDRMDVDTVIEIGSPDVQQGLANAKLIVQTLIPEVYRIYEGNKEGVLRSPVSVCPAFWGKILISDKDMGKISARLHYPVDVTEVVSGLNNPVGIAFSDGPLLIAELGEQRIACCDLTGEYFLNPEKMTVIKQLLKALNDRKLFRQGDRSKKSELQKVLKRWMHKKKVKVQLWKMLPNLPKCTLCPFVTSHQLNPPLLYSPLVKKNKICVAEITGEIHLMTVVTDGLNVTADIISSVSFGVHSLFGVACKISVEFYVSSSADAGGLLLVNFQTGHCERVLCNGSASLKQIHGICSKSDGKVILVDRGANKIK